MSYYIHQSFLYNYLVHIFCSNNSTEDFFAKSKKPHFFVDVEIIYPEVQVSNLYSVPMVARNIHTYTSENRNPTHPMVRRDFAVSGVRRFVGGG